MAEGKIADIRFTNLKSSKPSFLKSNLLSEAGQVLSDSLLALDMQRLGNLASINRADYSIDTIGDEIVVTFDVEEVRTLLPVLNSGAVEGNTFIEIGFTDINWGGRGHQVSASYQNNDTRHGGKFFFQNPRIKNSNWGFNSSLSSWASREPLFFTDQTVIYNYDNDGIGLTAIRHLNYNNQIQLGATYFVETYDKFGEAQPDFDGPIFLRQAKWLSKVFYSHNKVNSYFFYLTGTKYQSNFQAVYNTFDNTLFLSLQFQLSNYLRVSKKGNFANQIRIGVASNSDSPFAPFVADSNINIRGIGNRIDRGTAQIIINSEYRHTVMFKKKWALQVTAFSDLGTWRNPGGSLGDLFNPDQFRLFVGGGIRIIYHRVYGAILRIDYGVDRFNTSQRGLVVGLGQFF